MSPPTMQRRARSISYSELKITGPPLYGQGKVVEDPNVGSSSLSPKEESSSSSTLSSSFPSLDASKTALLVVDIQPEYWSNCPAVRQDFPNFPDKVAALLKQCRHPTDGVGKIVWVRAEYSYETSPWLAQFSRLHKGRIPPIVAPSTEWESFATPDSDSPKEHIMTKSSWSSTSQTELLDILRDAGIETVLVCGLITSVCVQHSAFGVFEAGFRTMLVTDACADRGKHRHDAALALYGDYMYELSTVDSLKAEMSKAANASSEVRDETEFVKLSARMDSICTLETQATSSSSSSSCSETEEEESPSLNSSNVDFSAMTSEEVDCPQF